jgi:hypothetical protein
MQEKYIIFIIISGDNIRNSDGCPESFKTRRKLNIPQPFYIRSYSAEGTKKKYVYVGPI